MGRLFTTPAQRFLFHGSRSDGFVVTAGVPQSCVLGPTSFSLHTNHLCLSNYILTVLHGDDITLLPTIPAVVPPRFISLPVSDGLTSTASSWICPSVSSCGTVMITLQKLPRILFPTSLLNAQHQCLSSASPLPLTCHFWCILPMQSPRPDAYWNLCNRCPTTFQHRAWAPAPSVLLCPVKPVGRPLYLCHVSQCVGAFVFACIIISYCAWQAERHTCIKVFPFLHSFAHCPQLCYEQINTIMLIIWLLLTATVLLILMATWLCVHCALIVSVFNVAVLNK